MANPTGYMGVKFMPRKHGPGKWGAQVSRGGKYWNGGTFDTAEHAAAAVQEHIGKPERAAKLRKLGDRVLAGDDAPTIKKQATGKSKIENRKSKIKRPKTGTERPTSSQPSSYECAGCAAGLNASEILRLRASREFVCMKCRCTKAQKIVSGN